MSVEYTSVNNDEANQPKVRAQEKHCLVNTSFVVFSTSLTSLSYDNKYTDLISDQILKQTNKQRDTPLGNICLL